MVTKKEFVETLIDVRNDLGYERGVIPIIQEIHEAAGSIDVIVSDRPEKSLLLGPGGRIVARLATIFGLPVTIHSKIDLLSRRHKLSLTLKRIEEMSNEVSRNQLMVLEQVKRDILVELEYPNERICSLDEKGKTSIAVAFSGGVDSGAALYWADRVSQSVRSITVDLGFHVLGAKEKAGIVQLNDELGIDYQFLDISSKLEKVFSRAKNGHVHPCGRCHSVTMETLREYVRNCGMEVLLTGEMLPTGRQSIELIDDLIVIHLPAALSLSKFRTQKWSEKIGLDNPSIRFGCRFIAQCHRQGWKMIGPSIYRVLRETEAGILTTGQSLSQIKNILQAYLNTTNREGSE